MRLSFATILVALAGTAVAQVPLPPHASVYNGFTRGYNFVAQTSFNIVGLDLPTNAFQAGDTAGYLVRINGATALWSIGNVGAITTNIPVVIGDNVDVMGNWSPAVTNNFTAHNSYGTGPFATTIEGVPHTLTRCGWQWDIGSPAWVSTGGTGTYLAPTTGQLGRVIMFTAAGSGTVLATNTTLGTGCVSAADVPFYENFATAAGFDLANSAFQLVHTGAGYLALPSTAAYVPPSGAAQVLALTDDSEVNVTLSQAMPVGSAGSTTTLTVCSNGYISAGSGNGTGFAPTPATFVAGTRPWWSLAWHDLNPAAAGSGQVKFEQVGTTAYVTWEGVYDFGGTTAANANTFQAQFDLTTGSVVFVYQTMSTLGNGFLTGFSDAGASADPGSMDISAALPATFTSTFAQVPLAVAASTRPITGTTWNLNVTNVPPTGTIGLEIFGLSDPAITDLGFLGAPGCQARASLDVLNAWVVGGQTSHAYGLVVPANPALLNFHVFTSAAVLKPGVNTLLGGVLTSNGIDGKVGDF
jgi:hypothetical protein